MRIRTGLTALPTLSLLVAMLSGTAMAASNAPHANAEQTLEAVLWLLNAGVVAEDKQVIKALLYAEKDGDLKLVEALAERVISSARFNRVASEHFGADECARLMASYRVVDCADFGMFLLAAKWEINGEVATVASADAARLSRNEIELPRFVSRAGVWKMDVTPRAATASVKDLVSAVAKHSRILSETATAIETGKVKTVGEVEQLLRALPSFESSATAPDLVLELHNGANAATRNAKRNH